MGKTWTEVSPDLTKNEKAKQGRPGVPYTNEAVGAENYGTLAYVIESPYEKGVIYTGSDDGYVYLTKDNGVHWQNITPAGLPECLINAIEISPFDKATAYIATTRYKFNDHNPGLYKTTDYGKTWTKINNGIPYGAFTRVVREDDKRKDLLFAGTETGIYISRDGGKNWVSFQLNMPVTPITDLRIHQGNLIAATSGRSFWILDDLDLIRQYKKEVTAFSIFDPSPAFLINGSSELDESSADFTGQNKYSGVNPSTGVVIYYQLADPKDSIILTMEIKDATGNLVNTFSSKKDSTYKKYDGGPPAEPVLSKAKGLNRFVWNMRYTTMPGVPDVYIEASYRGHKAIPGKYTVTLKMGEQKLLTNAEILANPLYPTDAVSYKEYNSIMSSMENELSAMHKMVNSMNEKRVQLESLLASLTAEEKYKTLKTKGSTLTKKMKAWDEDMIQRKTKVYDDADNFPAKFTANYLFLINQTESDIPSVNKPSLDRLQELNAAWAVLKARAKEILDKNIPALNNELWEAGLGAIWKN